ncbi:hypothetical protein CDAR_9801 [Caerostris darwini]|uniref:Uncharacterized protein n=1 Tax=Caerostris darwini TaxID=1538125 RepID=A0AAV4URE5_9ARAC|nr:hypothetical protein CDAR_9801 [Caerostris darwini]
MHHTDTCFNENRYESTLLIDCSHFAEAKVNSSQLSEAGYLPTFSTAAEVELQLVCFSSTPNERSCCVLSLHTRTLCSPVLSPFLPEISLSPIAKCRLRFYYSAACDAGTDYCLDAFVIVLSFTHRYGIYLPTSRKLRFLSTLNIERGNFQGGGRGLSKVGREFAFVYCEGLPRKRVLKLSQAFCISPTGVAKYAGGKVVDGGAPGSSLLCAGRVAFTFTSLCQSACFWKAALLATCLDLCASRFLTFSFLPVGISGDPVITFPRVAWMDNG